MFLKLFVATLITSAIGIPQGTPPSITRNAEVCCKDTITAGGALYTNTVAALKAFGVDVPLDGPIAFNCADVLSNVAHSIPCNVPTLICASTKNVGSNLGLVAIDCEPKTS
ncbi:hypothetical protein B0H19DRAFT_1260348 [Mycena capillaripes]|nr:hypothetical protein B0H19DRAFT_1260348 [Mycena capillaripes]